MTAANHKCLLLQNPEGIVMIRYERWESAESGEEFIDTYQRSLFSS